MLSPNQVIVGYQSAVAETRSLVLDISLRLWANVDHRDGGAFTKAIIPIVRAGQLRTAQLTAAYVSVMAEAKGQPKIVPRVDPVLIAGARKVDPVVEYQRPSSSVYIALSKGDSFVSAVAAGATRLQDLVTTDLQLAKTVQAQQSYTQAGYTYYRRVLTGSENCALCTIASTQRYHVADLLPIHPGCDCGVDTITSKWEPPHILEPELLADTHARVEAFTGVADAGGRSPDYRKLLVTQEHGEWGPTLAWLGENFDGPAAVL